jgi:hypothetical protein
MRNIILVGVCLIVIIAVVILWPCNRPDFINLSAINGNSSANDGQLETDNIIGQRDKLIVVDNYLVVDLINNIENSAITNDIDNMINYIARLEDIGAPTLPLIRTKYEMTNNEKWKLIGYIVYAQEMSENLDNNIKLKYLNENETAFANIDIVEYLRMNDITKMTKEFKYLSVRALFTGNKYESFKYLFKLLKECVETDLLIEETAKNYSMSIGNVLLQEYQMSLAGASQEGVDLCYRSNLLQILIKSQDSFALETLKAIANNEKNKQLKDNISLAIKSYTIKTKK